MPMSSVFGGPSNSGSWLDLYASFKFHVEIGSILTAAFTECSGLEMSTEACEYAEGGTSNFVHVFPGRTRYSNVTLKRGLVTTNELFLWYKKMEDCLRQGRPFEFQPVSIILWNPDQSCPRMRWDLDRALPVKWAGPAFKSDAAEVSIETLVLAHHGIQAAAVAAE